MAIHGIEDIGRGPCASEVLGRQQQQASPPW
jgi:hypothetical protein